MGVDRGYGSGKSNTPRKQGGPLRKPGAGSTRPDPLSPRGPGKPRKPGIGTKPDPLTPHTPGRKRPKQPGMGYGPGRKPIKRGR